MATREELEQLFRRHGISFDEPGFYDSPEFQRGEREDLRFLENYAEYIQAVQFDDEYLGRARRIIRKLAEFVANEVRADGRAGACIDASGAVMRMLEREGVWSCMIGGAAIVFYPPCSGLDTRYFWPFVHPDNPAKTRHLWLLAPPLKVLDVTLSAQNWSQRELKYIPQSIACEQWQPEDVQIGDLMENELVELFYHDHGRMPTMRDIHPEQLRTMQKFPAFSVAVNDTRIKYVPTMVSAMDGGLEDMRNLYLRGSYPAELYEHFCTKRAERNPLPEGRTQ